MYSSGYPSGYSKRHSLTLPSQVTAKMNIPKYKTDSSHAEKQYSIADGENQIEPGIRAIFFYKGSSWQNKNIPVNVRQFQF
jgi:hypothetical protein